MNMIEFDGRECVDMDRVCHFCEYADTNNNNYSVRFLMFGSDRLLEIQFRTKEEAIRAYDIFKKATNTIAADVL